MLIEERINRFGAFVKLTLPFIVRVISILYANICTCIQFSICMLACELFYYPLFSPSEEILYWLNR